MTVTAGVLSNIARYPNELIQLGQSGGCCRYLQTDAAINPGNSGGPLVNMNGELVGMNTFIVNHQYGEGLGFAIPVDIILYTLNHFKKYHKVLRPYIGLKIALNRVENLNVFITYYLLFYYN